jgi:hypothetical protein
MASPKLNTLPLSGWLSVTVGRPTPITTLAVAVRPVLSRTVNVAVNSPLDVYVNDGFAAVESVLPFVVKSHAYVIGSPSGSPEPAELNCTVNGAFPLVGFADADATGDRPPPLL